MLRISQSLGAVVLAIVLIAVGACSAGPSERPAVAYRDSEQTFEPAPRRQQPQGVPPLGPPARNTLDWRDCTKRTRTELGGRSLPSGMAFSCAHMLTSLNPPGSLRGGITRLSLLAVGNGTIPLVVVNDINGESGTTFAARLALRLPDEVLNTFRIIGVDRRGTGHSDPAACIPPGVRHDIVGFDPRATRMAALDRLLDSVRQASQECLLDLQKRAQAYDTWRAAADLEELRIELGVPRLHAIGRGEGSRVLTTYAQRYPSSVGRIVLDGAPDPVLDVLRRAQKQARSAEDTFDVFAQECTEDGRCPLGPNPRKAVDRLIEKTRETPLPVQGSQVSAGKVVRAILQGLSDPEKWPELAQALAAARSGDGSGIAELVAPLVEADLSGPPGLDSQLITRCNDTTLRLPRQRGAAIATEWVQQYPLFGGVFAQRLIQCSLWPVPRKELPEPTRPGLPPMPVVVTAHDPLTPELGTKHMADQLARGIAITWQGAGHGAIGRSSCITSKISDFLVHGKVPVPETVCPA